MYVLFLFVTCKINKSKIRLFSTHFLPNRSNICNLWKEPSEYQSKTLFTYGDPLMRPWPIALLRHSQFDPLEQYNTFDYYYNTFCGPLTGKSEAKPLIFDKKWFTEKLGFSNFWSIFGIILAIFMWFFSKKCKMTFVAMVKAC